MTAIAQRPPDSSDSECFIPPFVPPVSLSRSEAPVATEPAPQIGAGVFGGGNRIGHWQLEREVGRGGMGVVYSAIDTQLERRVAIKLLPTMAALEPKKLARFQHEAQVVARLSHPHIVPLHSMEADQGLHFLVMQLIDGVSLDRVAASSTAPLSSGSPDGTRILVTQAGDESSGGSANQRALVNPPQGIDGTHGKNEVHNSQASHHSQQIEAAPANTSDLWLRDKLFGEPHRTCRYIATLGWQAAEALSYAHSMGVIHRDVKPSNLIVDHDDNLWITDFGLAQIQGEQGLTMTGDLLGTLRYMSPEQGMAQRIPIDHRTDVYSLGVTLYELLAKRPAFEAEDRKELLRQVLFDDPIPLRKHDPHIPFPLQVIVEKAMQKDQRQRYATARALADDLRRWLDGEPILARPPTVIERVSHWASRRKGAVATGLVSLFVLLVTLAALSQRHAGELRDELAKTEAARATAVRGEFAALLLQAQSGRAAERPGRRLESLRAVTRAAELARKLTISDADRVRLRSETIAALGVPFDVEPLGEIELDFPSGLSFPDATFQQIARVTHADGTITVSPVDADLFRKQLDTTQETGTSAHLPVVSDSRKLMKLDGGGRQLKGFGIRPNFFQFSLDGRRLIADYEQQDRTVVVWNLETGSRVYQVKLGPGRSWVNSVSVGDRMLAAIDEAGELRLFDLVDLRETDHFPIGELPVAIGLTNSLPSTGGWALLPVSTIEALTAANRNDPNNTGKSTHPPEMLAIGRGAPDRVEIIDVASREVRESHSAPGPLTMLLRSLSGGLVGSFRSALGYGFWDLLSTPPFANVEQQVFMLDVTPQGDLLVFEDTTGNTELRDTRTGQRSLQLNGKLIGFDATGELLALRTKFRVSFYRIHRSSQVRRLRPPGQTASVGIYNASFSSDSRLMAVTSPAGARLYDVATGRLIDTIAPKMVTTNVAFIGSPGRRTLGSRTRQSSDGSRASLDSDRSLATSATGTATSTSVDDLLVSAMGVPLQRWRKVGDHWEEFDRQFSTAESRYPTPLYGNGFLSVSQDGQMVARAQFSDEAIVWRDTTQFTRLGPHPGLNRVAVSPDGKWCVTGQHISSDLILWDTVTGERLRNVWPKIGSVDAVFSPDGRWLLASSGIEFRVFDTATWDVVWTHAREDGSDAPAPIAFSPDGRQFAIAHNQSTMQIYSTGDWSLYAEMAVPESGYIGAATFSPDGRWLVRNTSREVFVWDLHAIRDELQVRGID